MSAVVLLFQLLGVLLLIAFGRLTTAGYTLLEVILLLSSRALCAARGRITWHSRREGRTCQSLTFLGDLSRDCASCCGLGH
jgi:hypothetical protein